MCPNYFGRRRGSAIVCKYLSYKAPNKPRPFRLPLIHVKLKSASDTIRTVGLVDSGSTTTFLPKEFAEILDLPKVKDDTAIGAGGHFDTYIAKLGSLILLKSSAVFGELKDIEVQIPKAEEAIPYVVLGRDYLFRSFQVTFKETEQHVVFRAK